MRNRYPIQKVTEIYNKVTEPYNILTELENSIWNVLCLLLSEERTSERDIFYPKNVALFFNHWRFGGAKAPKGCENVA